MDSEFKPIQAHALLLAHTVSEALFESPLKEDKSI
jgi:hypothetical protein